MIKTFAVVQNDVVVNLVEADTEDADTITALNLISTGTSTPAIGWGYAAGVFTPPTTDLAQAKADKLVQIEQWRDTAIGQDVVVGGVAYQADARSQSLLGQAITLAQAGLPLPSVWRAADNTDTTITSLMQLLEIAGAMALQVQSAYARSWQLKGAVDAATTTTEVEDVTW